MKAVKSENGRCVMSAVSRYRIAAWAGVLCLFALAAVLFVRGMSGVRSVAAPLTVGAATVGQALPDARLLHLDGSSTALRSYVGRPLWINFFETWCAPCKAEAPQIVSRYDALRGRGLVVLGIDEQEEPSQVSAFAKRFHAGYSFAVDEGQAAVIFRVHIIPVSVFVDAAGTVRWIQIGQMTPNAMDSALAKIM